MKAKMIVTKKKKDKKGTESFKIWVSILIRKATESEI